MDKYVAMQTIKDAKDEKIIGQEVLVQFDREGLYNSEELATADTIINFLVQNTERIFNGRKVFITFTPSLIFRNTPRLFDKESLVIQLEDNVIIHPLSMVTIKKHREEGYVFAINDFRFSPKYFTYLEYADYVKIDVHGKSQQAERLSLENIVRMVSGFGKKCIASGIENKEDYELALALGTDYLEGSYISEPSFSKYNKLDYLEGNFFQLVVEISKDEPDIDVLEAIFRRDTALTYSLLKMVNSAYFALKKRTSSIRQALVTMGINQLKQWIYLLSFNKNNEMDEGVEQLLKTSFLRATFSQALSERIGNFPLSKSDAYMIGMFSTLEYLIDAPLEEILDQIPVEDEIREALLHQEGICGKLYQLILAYEKVDWKTVRTLSDELGIRPGIMSQIYMDCVDEVDTIWKGLTTASNAMAEAEEELEKTK